MSTAPKRKMAFFMNRRDRRQSDERAEELTEEGKGLMSPPAEDHEWARVSPKLSSDKSFFHSSSSSPRSPRRRLFSRRFTLIILAVSVILLIAGILLYFKDLISVAILRNRGVPPGLWSRDGTLLVGEDTMFMIKGFSWYGMEEPNHVPGGLMKTSVAKIFEFTKLHKFNAIRIPLSIDGIKNNPISSKGIAAFLNPELSGVRYLDMLGHIIKEAAKDDILILLDMHRLHSSEVKSNGLWYSKDVPEEDLIQAWVKLCDEFANEWNIVGADVFNEPWDALWNATNKARDWKDASERIGDAIHKSCPSWLLFIEGVGDRAGGVKTSPFWSENLRAMQNAPPELELSSKVVLSPHVYGPSVFMQDYFKGDNFSAGMPAIWDDHFGDSAKATGLATVIGEWGGFYVDKDEEWQNAFFKYISENTMGFFYWCLNPESGDTGGLLTRDWVTPEKRKLELLENSASTDVGRHLMHFKHLRDWREK